MLFLSVVVANSYHGFCWFLFSEDCAAEKYCRRVTGCTEENSGLQVLEFFD